ncbi:CGNR zinc finger domain-containing protein [Streptomyces sp. NPDC046853]|uniref:CGNR zinc finger domain-containing protein n=1 Tax=Streptomyces sp. NPDC046853 TaxID=3154920 RepID=UPI0033DAC748
MLFDSHVTDRLEDAASLVNALTGGAARGRPHPAPTDEQLPEAIAAALPYLRKHTIDTAQAAYLVRTAQQLRLAFEAVSGGHTDDAAAVVNTLLVATGARPRLRRDTDQPWRLHFHGADDSPAVSTSASCATGLALALDSDMTDRLGVCQATRCDRVYIDTTRNTARQFCSTACQNRTKAAAFRARRNTGTT